MCKKESSDNGQTQLEVVIVFCSNCGSPLAEGAKFCSECGTKVGETKSNDFGTLEFEEPSNIADTLAGKAPGAEEAFDARVSFDWSNVIDEPQKKEVPQGIKSPWANTTGSIDERDIYSEMTESDDRNRTMSFIDVLKADKEERERAALDRSIEYTEVLEYDPELVGGTKPPKLRMAPLYEDVDAPVKTPFDDVETSEPEDAHIPSFEQTAEEKAVPEKEPAPAKFELPDFLKKAVGFGAGKDEVVEVEREETVELPAEEPEVESFAFEEPAVEKHAAPEPVAEEVSEPFTEEAHEESAEDAYLDEDLYLELSEPPRSDRISRIDAHAAEYDEDDDDEADEPIDEDELFTEMTEPEQKKTGMTIAAPADEEAEIEALKKRLAELTGTVEIDPSLLEENETEEPESEEPEEVVPAQEEEPAEEDSFEALGADFTFEPEVTPADNAVFDSLTPASEPTTPVVEPASEPTFDDFMFEPEITPEDDEMFAGLTPASEPAAPVAEPVVETPSIEVAEHREEPVVEPPVVEPIAEPVIETAADLTEHKAEDALLAAFTPKENQDDSPVVGFAPAVTEMPMEETPEEPTAAEPAVISLEDFVTETKETEKVEEAVQAEPVFEASIVEPVAEPVVEAPVVEPVAEPVAETPAVEPVAEPIVETPVVEEPKTTDAVSLEDLEKDIFGPSAGGDTEAETTKKIDKFYTLYRKNEEFQRLLDEEYSRLKGEHIEVPEEAAPVAETAGVSAAIVGEIKEAAAESTIPEQKELTMGLVGAEPILEEIAAESKPVEDATIYQVNMPEDLAEIAKNAEDNSGFNVKGTEEKSFGLGEAAGTVAAGAAAGAALTKAEKKAAKKAEKKAKKEAAKSADPQVEYENVDGGSTILTILAVIVAILLVVLLAVILILHLAPMSGPAVAIDSFIEDLTSRFSAINTFGGYRLL